jgi:dTDP-4-dehydrorhamnose reductase
MSARVLVTGGGGQLAAEFAAVYADADVWAPGHRELDVTDERAVDAAFERHDPSVVLHCAAWTDVDGAEADPEGAMRVNERGSRLVARAARRHTAILLAYSTDYVFDGTRVEGYVESDAPAPRSAYGRSKLAGEAAVLEEEPGAYVVRTAWVFSPRGRNFVRTMLRLGAELETLRVVDDQRGCPTYTRHLAEATRSLVEGCRPGIYHLAGGGACSWYELTCEIVEAAGLPARVEPISSEELTRPAPRPAVSILRSEHACTPALPHWREGLHACLRALPATKEDAA